MATNKALAFAACALAQLVSQGITVSRTWQ